MAKRKRSTISAAPLAPAVETPVLPPRAEPPSSLVKPTRRAARGAQQTNNLEVSDSNEGEKPTISNGSATKKAKTNGTRSSAVVNGVDGTSKSSPSAVATEQNGGSKRQPAKAKATTGKKAAVNGAKTKAPEQDDGMAGDPEAEENEEEDEVEEIQAAATRPPAVNSDYLPLPWKGRLGYACLCTYLRYANPAVFSSRTCRMASIIEHRHPLKDTSQPEHATKNRPDRDQPADLAKGQAYVEALGLANAKDIVKMLRWNAKYGIKFLRLSSEMFPFASHEQLGYKLAPFAAEALGEAGRVAGELGHRLTTHPGQFTQLGSPRNEVIRAAIRDLDYHSELLSLLKLPPQQDRDAVMILHMGGAFGDKEATLNRFREHYKALSPDVKKRLVLENDDVTWSVHELLPVCKELSIPLVLDYHHHNIIHSDEMREGTYDIMSLYDEIRETWTRKGITQKMHYSEPTPPAITGRDRRKHNPRVATLPPCANDMDLMIEAKDKEQAVFELMRNFRLPGYDRIGPMIPHVRIDENKPEKKAKATPKKKKPAKAAKLKEEEDAVDVAAEYIEEEEPPTPIPAEEVSMGGPEGRVYWPPGMEEWLRPPKRVVKKKDAEAVEGKPETKATGSAAKSKRKVKSEDVNGEETPVKSVRGKKAAVPPNPSSNNTKPKAKPKLATRNPTKDAEEQSMDDASGSSELSNDEDEDMPDLHSDGAATPTQVKSSRKGQVNGTATSGRRKSGRMATQVKKVDYNEGDEESRDEDEF
ncbi:MAG: UV-damage endonuclease [Chaenotheca gracillima]|nr:MAG: UV-damage endonuclease [Chaenotheca gracillima]